MLLLLKVLRIEREEKKVWRESNPWPLGYRNVLHCWATAIAWQLIESDSGTDLFKYFSERRTFRRQLDFSHQGPRWHPAKSCGPKTNWPTAWGFSIKYSFLQNKGVDNRDYLEKYRPKIFDSMSKTNLAVTNVVELRATSNEQLLSRIKYLELCSKTELISSQKRLKKLGLKFKTSNLTLSWSSGSELILSVLVFL